MHVHVYLLIDILCRYMYTSHLSALYLGFSLVLFFIKDIEFYWHWSYCERVQFVNILFSVDFCMVSPQNLNQFEYNLCKYASVRQLWHCFCLYFGFVFIDLLNQTVSLFIVIMIWYLFTTFCDVLMTTFHSCVRLSSYLYSCLCSYNMFTKSIYQLMLHVN